MFYNDEIKYYYRDYNATDVKQLGEWIGSLPMYVDKSSGYCY